MTDKLMRLSSHPGLWCANTPKHTQAMIESLPTLSQGRIELEKIAPQLVRLSHQGQWIVLINPPNIGYKAMLAAAGVRLDRVLLVKAKDEVEALWASEIALTNGTCSAVLTWISSLDQRDQRRMQLVERNARAMGFIFENSTTAHHKELTLNNLPSFNRAMH
ncbi:SulA-like leucine-rich domain-containing protein [Shewanella sp. NIFS-20-20]|uniref:SulA-like leucine-rich domain-containing protein n=1 Tax=Shewanella sp. NIFS-20-20 TaxID=2853806 RepID=UPI001C47DF2E|nr:SulA-like leucine-rich domain-containing protein [Shewanella sp. NIFS-20-20]MBV7316928.1 cell division protein [Shewanella sp. NIFS-20-20]